MIPSLAAATLALAAAAPTPSPSPSPSPFVLPNQTLTAVPGIKVGHFTLTERPTGCTVILTETGAVASVDVRGGAPGTRETDLLNPVNHVQKVNAIVLSGGSAFGLDAASGVVRYLDERDFGYDVRIAKVPIVPAAILFDLDVGGKPKVRPTAECGYAAALAATNGPVAEGSIGAGAGATVGKMAGPARMTKSGIGTASITLADGLVVAALVAVNAAGDIIDPATGRVVAGVRTADGKGFADARVMLRSGAVGRPLAARPVENTTIGVVATNAALTKVQALKVAQMAHDGYARAISPVHTPGDGDTIFAIATGTTAGEVEDGRMGIIGALAAEVMADAIVRAATQATGAAGIPAMRDLPVPSR
jgi:L-aminopeptidase/D-esterase-like protein